MIRVGRDVSREQALACAKLHVFCGFEIRTIPILPGQERVLRFDCPDTGMDLAFDDEHDAWKFMVVARDEA